MNYFGHYQNRRRRKLPYVQRKQLDSSIFWPSFHGALAWTRKNQETIDTAMKLLEIYPSLIQDRSLDGLWEFINPFFEAKSNQSTPSTNVPVATNMMGSPVGHCIVTIPSTNMGSPVGPCTGTIPSICVTNCDNEPREKTFGMSLATSNLPKISVVGDPCNGKSNLLRLVNDISVFALTITDPVHESDVCVFLLNYESICSNACYRDLMLASTLDIPILFVKQSGFKLPSPLPDSVIHFALGCTSGMLRTRTNNRGGSALSTRTNEMKPEARSGSARKYTNNVVKYPFIRQNSDLVMLLIDGYKNSIEYDANNHDASINILKQRIQNVTKMNLSSATSTESNLFFETTEPMKTSGNFLSVPNPDADISWIDSDEIECDTDVPPESVGSPDFTHEDRTLSELLSDVDSESSLSEKETFYFVSNEKSGKVVKWPPTRPGTCSETSSVSDSPISIRNSDFQNFQTDMDLYDSDSTLEFNE